MKLDINTETCTGCKLCETVCIRDNIQIIDKKAVEIDNGDCFDLFTCEDATVKAGTPTLISLGVSMRLPKGDRKSVM